MHILVVDEMHHAIIEGLEEMGAIVHYHPQIHTSEIAGMLEKMDGLVVRSKVFVDESLLANAPNIRFIARSGSGTDNLDESYLKNRGISILNAPEGNRDAVGDHTVGMMLALINNFKKAGREIAQGTWDREGNRGYEMSELTIGIYGFGHTGGAVAKTINPYSQF